MGLTNTLPKQVMELKQQNNFTVNKKKYIYKKKSGDFKAQWKNFTLQVF